MGLESLRFLSLLVTILFSNCDCHCVSELQQCIRNAKSTIELIAPGNATYEELNYSQNIRKVIKPKGFIFVNSSFDVKISIKCLVELKIQFAIKCGGHSYEQYSYGSDKHWVVDVSKLRSFEIDKKNLVATVGSGYRVQELSKLLWENGKFGLPFGTCGYIGITGFTLGGGIGKTSRKYGLMVDRVMQMKIVTADGEIITASKTSHPDLFWALRGAGASNFGIVTEFKYNIYDASSNVYTVIRYFDFKDFIRYFKTWQKLVELNFNNSLSAEFSCLLGSCSFVSVITNQDSKERERVLRKLKEVFGDIKDDEIKSQSQVDMLNELNIYTFPYYLKATSFFVSKLLTENEINAIYAALNKPTAGVLLSMKLLGGMANVPLANSMAFCHRKSAFTVQFGVGDIVSDDSLIGKIRDKGNKGEHFVSEFLNDTQFMNNGESYQNYIDADLPNWMQKYYCGNRFRLTSIKQKYDPQNVFKFEQSIPLF